MSKRALRLLTVDVGNTCMVFGLYRGEQLTGCWRLSSDPRATADELALKLTGLMGDARVDGILAASVVPHLDGVLKEACERVFGRAPAFVGSPEVKTGMAVDYKNPREVGADRIANAVAARERMGSPVIVLDCGTATTFDVVSPEGHYAGGLILPGVELALEALAARAARLPEASFARVETLIARDTVASMQAGSYWGAVEAFSGIIRRLRAEPGYANAPVIATGGLAGLLADDLPAVTEHRPLLTLEGLLHLARRHFGGA
jgi:type III pantothenate kinase